MQAFDSKQKSGTRTPAVLAEALHGSRSVGTAPGPHRLLRTTASHSESRKAAHQVRFGCEAMNSSVPASKECLGTLIPEQRGSSQRAGLENTVWRYLRGLAEQSASTSPKLGTVSRRGTALQTESKCPRNKQTARKGPEQAQETRSPDEATTGLDHPKDCGRGHSEASYFQPGGRIRREFLAFGLIPDLVEGGRHHAL